MGKEAGPRIPPVNTIPHCGQMEILWAKRRDPVFHQSTQYHTVVRWKSCGQRGGTPYSTSQHNTTLWSDGNLVGKEAGPRIPPVNTIPHCGQMEILWAKRRDLVFHQSTQYHTVVRWKSCGQRGGTPYSTSQHNTRLWSDGNLVGKEAGPRIPPVNTIPHCGQMEILWAKRRDPVFHQSTQYHTAVRWKSREERGRA